MVVIVSQRFAAEVSMTPIKPVRYLPVKGGIEENCDKTGRAPCAEFGYTDAPKRGLSKMQRSPGVTASAVVAMLGSLGLGVFGIFMVLGALMVSFAPVTAQAPYPSSFPIVAILVIESVVVFGFAIFGIASGIGLLRLKNWARVSFLVFGVILAFGAGSSLLGSIMGMLAMPQMLPPNPDVPPGFMTGVFLFMAFVALMSGALAIWWLIYFSRRAIKVQFMGEAAAAVPRRGPVSITVIGWLLVVGAAPLVLISLFFPRYPAMMLGMIIEGWPGRVVYLLIAAFNLVTGIGLLKWRHWAHSMALGLYAFGAINIALSFVTGALSRMQEMIGTFLPPPYPTPQTAWTLQLSMISGMALSIVIFWLLISRRRAFLNACDAPPAA
jgi:hypothetical protein